MATDDDAGPTAQLPIRSNRDMESFDIVQTYYRLLGEDPDLTMPLAAIGALIECIGASSAQTVFETMDLVETQSATLRARVPNPVPLAHGTEFFKQYLVQSLRQPGTSGHQSFDRTRQHLVSNARLFAHRAKEQREKLADVARRYIEDGDTIMTYGGSRAVATLLERAAEPQQGSPKRRFKVIYVEHPTRLAESAKIVAALRAKGVPVATISTDAVAYAMVKVQMVLVGAEAVFANGGILSRMGTLQIAAIAKEWGKKVYVAAEQHKFGAINQTFPTTQFNIGVEQDVIVFHKGDDEKDNGRQQADRQAEKVPAVDPVDYTTPDFIEAFFCNHGVKSPRAVESEIIDTLY
ncbi:translation initiation factor-like protein eif-2b subunit alpha [Xylariaceae sp. FL0016]|nr:translation initiation factor-like protein eif-2b subunit alpha [Xylariaceae sp. FL0016]